MKTNIVYCGDAAEMMREHITDDSIDLIVSSPPYDCYSDDTEVLTKNGWKLIKDVQIGEEVMTLNPITKEIFFQLTTKTYNYDFDGKLISFFNNNIDLQVTDNHNMFITNYDKTAYRERKPFVSKDKLKSSYLKPAKDVKKSGVIPYTGYKWKGKNKDVFLLPKVKCIYNKQCITYEAIEIKMLYWVRFLGIYLSDGYSRNTKNKSEKVHSYEVAIKQKNEQECLIIEDVFKHLPFSYKKRKDNDLTTFSIVNRQLWDYLYRLGNSHKKYIPKDIKELNSYYLNELLLYLMIGDGTKRRHKNVCSFTVNAYITYKSHSTRLKDDVQECLLKIGKLSCEIKNHLISNKLYKNIKYSSVKKDYVYYKGKVVCLEVEQHNIICVRRKGKVVFSGNSLRTYKGFTFDFNTIAIEIHRVMKPGGVVIWVVGDQTIKGSETLTSFKQALFFKEMGFNVHDTMIFQKAGVSFPSNTRYYQVFDYMFVFSKGKPKTFNPICDQERKWPFRRWGKNIVRSKDGSLTEKKESDTPLSSYVMRTNIWRITSSKGFGQKKKEAYLHPATFPQVLAKDQIISWTNKGDLVLDPLCGSGTTCRMAKELGRQYICIDCSEEYCSLTKKLLDCVKEKEL